MRKSATILLKTFVGLAGLILLILGSGATYQVLAGIRDSAQNPAPGRMVDVGGFRLHINCLGKGSPAVIFDAGMADDSIAWHKVQPEVAKMTEACAYDRAGLGWSDSSPNARTSAVMVEELHSLLRNANVGQPYILVGHSFGGMNMRLYASAHPKEVVGLILVDSSTPNQYQQMPAAILAFNASFLRRRGYLEDTMPFGWPRISGWCDKWPVEVREARRTTECLRKPWLTHLAEYEQFDQSSAQVARVLTLGSLPLTVLSHDPRERDATEAAWTRMQQNLANLSARSTIEIVPGSTHMIQEDHPEVVVHAVNKQLAALSRLNIPRSRGR